MKLGDVYANVTRPQIVEVTQIKKDILEYKVLEGNETNKMRVFQCTVARFQRLYLPGNKPLNF